MAHVKEIEIRGINITNNPKHCKGIDVRYMPKYLLTIFLISWTETLFRASLFFREPPSWGLRNGKYSCDGNTPYAGKEQDAHTGGTWYSFPSAGEGKYWTQTGSKEVQAGHFIESIGNVVHCDCSASSVSSDSCSTCGHCVMAAFSNNHQSIDKVWADTFHLSLTNETPIVV